MLAVAGAAYGRDVSADAIVPAMVDTLGLWLGPTVAVLLVAIGNKYLGWLQPRSRRRAALRRIAERLAYEDSHGYDYQYGRYLEHYLGGRD